MRLGRCAHCAHGLCPRGRAALERDLSPWLVGDEEGEDLLGCLTACVGGSSRKACFQLQAQRVRAFPADKGGDEKSPALRPTWRKGLIPWAEGMETSF